MAGAIDNPSALLYNLEKKRGAFYEYIRKF